MVEMLLSLNIWLLLCTILLPQLMMVLVERRNTEITSTGSQVLLEELQEAYQQDSISKEERVITRGKISYLVSWKIHEGSQKWEACVSWKDKLNRSMKRCGYTNQ